MFDGHFHSLGSFTDANVASQYPGNTVFQVENVDGKLYVTFAGFTPPFGGVVDVFDTDGNLLTPNHFAANAPGMGPLVNPWGIEEAPSDFGRFSNDLLIGNVEDGLINVFQPGTGAFLGSLDHPDGTPIVIPGLWDLSFGAGSKNNGKTNQLFFTAGFTAEDPAGNGLFGMIVVARERHGHDGDGPESDAMRTEGGDAVPPGRALADSSAAGPMLLPPQHANALDSTPVGKEEWIRPVSASALLTTVSARRRMLDRVFADLVGSTLSGDLGGDAVPAWEVWGYGGRR
jgi:hypothetical protein